jgi:hypothetical protein
MKLPGALALGALCIGALGAVANPSTISAGDEEALLQVDRAAFGPAAASATLSDELLEANFTWTDSLGNVRSRLEILQALGVGKDLPTQASDGAGDGAASPEPVTTAHVYSQVGVIQENRGKLYVLRVWIKRAAGWRLLVYHAVSTGARAPAEADRPECENPCNTVPFEPRNEDEREVIRAYQSVERAVTARDSAVWAAHIADDFFAVTSNSDRPLDKTTRMAGLDNQKVAGIAPFPLVSARMLEFGDAMVMASLQQPPRGLPLRVTRIWFKRNEVWLEAYSYQTTIQSGPSR